MGLSVNVILDCVSNLPEVLNGHPNLCVVLPQVIPGAGMPWKVTFLPVALNVHPPAPCLHIITDDRETVCGCGCSGLCGVGPYVY